MTDKPTDNNVMALGLAALRRYHPSIAAQIEQDEPELIAEIDRSVTDVEVDDYLAAYTDNRCAAIDPIEEHDCDLRDEHTGRHHCAGCGQWWEP